MKIQGKEELDLKKSFPRSGLITCLMRAFPL